MKYPTHKASSEDLKSIASYFDKINSRPSVASTTGQVRRSGLSVDAGVKFVVKMPKKRFASQG